MQTRLWTKVCLIALVTVLLAGLSFAQTSNGTIAGVVTDATGAAVTNAKVTATSKATGEVRNAQTNSVGAYRFESLIPGPYSITVTAPSFATTTIDNLTVVGSVVTAANAELKPGSASETVTVEAQAETLQTESGDISHTISTAEISNLPVPNLNAYSLALQLPGVVTVSSAVKMTNGTAFAVNGTRPRSNNFLIEGQDNNDAGIKGQGLQPQNLDAIREVTVLTNSYAAEFGNAAGSVNNLIFKSGENGFHGALWDLHRNSALDGNDHYYNMIDQAKSSYRENTWGFDLGGPVKKDKAFFFVSHQWDWYRSQLPGATLILPTEAGYATLQNLMATSNEFQQAQLNAMFQAYGGLRGSPDARSIGLTQDIQMINDPFTGAARPSVEVGPLLRTVSDAENSAEFVIKGDYLATQNDTINLRYVRSANYAPYDFFNLPDTLPNFDTMQYGAAHNAGITYTHIFTPTLANEARISYGRIGFTFDFRPETWGNPQALSPTVAIGGLAGWGAPSGDPQARFHNTMQYQDSLSWTKGNHSFKFGADIQDVRVRDAIPFNIYGSIGYPDSICTPDEGCEGNVYASGLANYIDGFGGGGSATITFGSPVIHPHLLSQAYFLQDTWKIKPNLTLTYGLRYEFWGTPANSLPFPAADPTDLGNTDVLSRIPQVADSNNFGPRLGFAYTPHFAKWLFGEDKTVIRGGAGLFYDGIFTNILDNTAASSPNAISPAYVSRISGDYPRGYDGWSNDLIYTMPQIAASPYSTTQPISKNLVAPETYQWNFDIQRELPASFTLTAGYVGTRGAHLFTNTEANPMIEFGPRLFPDRGRIVMRDNEGDSIYHALNVKVDRRFSHGLMARVAYTWSKLIDDSSEIFTGSNGYSSYPVVQFPNPRGMYDRGLSAYDRRHALAISYIYTLPKAKASSWKDNPFFFVLGQAYNGWELSGTTRFESGAPANITLGGYDWNGDGIANDRPVLGSANAPYDTWAMAWGGSPTGYCDGTYWFYSWDDCYPVNASDVRFIVPGQGTVGTYGRNSYTTSGTQTWNFAASKTFKITERQEFQFKVEMLNPFNHANTGIPDTGLVTGHPWVGSTTFTCRANGLPDGPNCGHPGRITFGDESLTIGGARSIRFLLKWSF